MTTEADVRRMRCDALREWVMELVQKLDGLDEADYFGTEGWRHMLMEE